nr:MAG TPA: hypothetical protein [Caudoviricetes sp.]
MGKRGVTMTRTEILDLANECVCLQNNKDSWIR